MIELLSFTLFVSALFAIIVILNFLIVFIKFIYYNIKKIDYTFPETPLAGEHKYIKVSIFLIGLFHIIMSTFFTNTQIGSLYENKEYTEKYYVHFAYDDNDVKFYKIPADIYSNVDTHEDYDGSTHSVRNYYITKVYWPNGHIMNFDYQEIEPEKQCSVSDFEGNRYYIELTKDKAP